MLIPVDLCCLSQSLEGSPFGNCNNDLYLSMHNLSFISLDVLFNAFDTGPGVSSPYLNNTIYNDLLLSFNREPDVLS